MTKTLYNFAVISGDLAREVQRISGAHSQIHDAQVGMKMLAAAERGEMFITNDGPVHELDAIIRDALNDYPCTTIAYYRSILDPWNNTAVFLNNLIRKHRPDFEHDWATFIATGVAIIEPRYKHWLSLLPPPDNRAMNAAARKLSPADDSARAFLHALFDWLVMCNATKAVGVLAARCIGYSQDNSDLFVG